MKPQLYAISLGIFLFSVPALGGSIRYDLPELLGEIRFDGTQNFSGRGVQVETPFGFYSVTEARLVIEGRVSQGAARGDGVALAATEFALLPRVWAVPSFARSFFLDSAPTPEFFRLEALYPDPFVPETTPLPNPDGYPPISFIVSVFAGPSLATEYPPRLDPTTIVLSPSYVVDIPIIAHIDAAYIIFSGPTIVPEPSGWTCAGLLSVAIVLARRRLLSPGQ